MSNHFNFTLLIWKNLKIENLSNHYNFTLLIRKNFLLHCFLGWMKGICDMEADISDALLVLDSSYLSIICHTTSTCMICFQYFWVHSWRHVCNELGWRLRGRRDCAKRSEWRRFPSLHVLMHVAVPLHIHISSMRKLSLCSVQAVFPLKNNGKYPWKSASLYFSKDVCM